jgi:hypothetical protein
MLKLAWCSREAAAFAVTHWHYSHKMPVGKSNYIGVWEDGVFIGAVIFGRGNNYHMGEAFNLKQTEIIELTRIALTSHQAHVTRIMKIALLMIKQHNPTLRACLSYADQTQGHEGLIYHAGGWTYFGITQPITHYTDGTRKIHSRIVTPSGYARQFGRMTKVHSSKILTKQEEPGKHKFIWFFNRKERSIFHSKNHVLRKRVLDGASGDQPET